MSWFARQKSAGPMHEKAGTADQSHLELFDAVVIGGGPSGSTAATDLSKRGFSVLLLDRAGRIKPCGGAVPPRLIKDFEIPDELIVAKVNCARIVSPANKQVDMPIDGNGYVGMVDRDTFDEWLRERAGKAGAVRRTGTFDTLTRDRDGTAVVSYKLPAAAGGAMASVRAKCVVGADGALSAVAKQAIPGGEKTPFVFAYHEIIRSPARGSTPAAHSTNGSDFADTRCDVYYTGTLSPDFYAWIFPHGDTTSVGTGSAHKGFSLKGAVSDLRRTTGLDASETLRREGAPIPLKPLRIWDNGRDVILAGDAAGVVAPASGEGIYYAMYGGQLSAEAAGTFLETGNPKALAGARKQFMKAHGTVFWVLGIMQHFWYHSDKRRERFVTMCSDKDVQKLTWQSYMHKKLERTDPMAHVRIFFKDVAHLCGFVAP
jgi:geranylgeranyl diphosphate/geranylgeranyl-bacteriochlorophyllide a reductase